MENMLAGRKLPPLELTWKQLVRVLGPYAAGYPWAEGTLRDLWTRCAPVPDRWVGTPGEKRIVAPNHMGEWLADVLQRQGRPLSEAARIYNEFATGARNGRGERARKPGA